MTSESSTGETAGVSRRRLLAGIGGGVLLAASGLPRAAAATGTTADAFDDLRLAWRDRLTGVPFDPSDPLFRDGLRGLDSTVRTGRYRIDRSPDRTQVFTDLRFRDLSDPNDTQASWIITSTYTRLAGIAKGWATPGCTYYQNPDVLADVVAGLKTAHDHGYNAGIPREYSNWWDFEIGGPAQMLNTCALVHDFIDPADLADYLAAVDRFVPDPRYNMQEPYTELSTGANRADLCLNVALRGILGRSGEKITQARDALGEIFRYVSSGDGLYQDGSYIHHKTVAYTGAYGVILLSRVIDLLALLTGSPWEFGANRSVFLDSVERTYAPVVFNNQMMDFVRGRSLSRFGERGHHQAHTVIERVTVLADSVEQDDPQRAARWRAMCRGWLDRDTYDNVFKDASIPRIAVLSRLLADDSVKPAPEPVGFTMFAGMARAVHRRPGWALGIAMASKRVAYYETGAGENRKGFHTGEGATYLYNDADNGQFDDDYWPTVDPYRIPGITLNKMPLPDKTGGEWGEAHPASATWVGGASLEGRHGAVGMDLEGIQHRDLVGKQPPLRARKSWFCFDKYVIALGAGITDVSGHPVETIVENRSLHTSGRNVLTLDGEVQPTELGWSATRKVRWAHLEGVGGYLFPRTGARLSALREERTGAWQDIGNSKSDPTTRRFVTMWLDHGTSPTGADYAYVLVPGADAAQTAALAENPDFQILANTKDVQAVRVNDNEFGVNFFAAADLANIRVSAPCSVMLRRTSDQLVVSVADPTQSSKTVGIELTLGSYRLAEADPTVTVTRSSPSLVLSIDTSAGLGDSHHARFSRRC